MLDEINEEMYDRESIEFEEEYFRLVAAAKQLLLKKGSQVHSEVLQGESGSSLRNEDSNLIQTVKLPTINLPIFSGEYNEWLLFRFI